MTETAEGSEPKCVPLCGATKAYGSRVKWWHHEPQCPVRIVHDYGYDFWLTHYGVRP
jgi:hypothetical protein